MTAQCFEENYWTTREKQYPEEMPLSDSHALQTLLCCSEVATRRRQNNNSSKLLKKSAGWWHPPYTDAMYWILQVRVAAVRQKKRGQIRNNICWKTMSGTHGRYFFSEKFILHSCRRLVYIKLNAKKWKTIYFTLFTAALQTLKKLVPLAKLTCNKHKTNNKSESLF